MKSLRILMIIHTDLTNLWLGGTENYATTLARYLTKIGHEVTIVHPIFNNQLAPGSFQKSHYSQISTIEFNMVSDGTQTDFNNIYIVSQFEKILRFEKYDIAHIHHLHHFSASILKLFTAYNIPSIFTFHDEWLVCQQMHYLHKGLELCSGPESISKCRDCLMERFQVYSNSQNIETIDKYIKNRTSFIHNSVHYLSAIVSISSFTETITRTYLNSYSGICKLIPLGLNTDLLKPLLKQDNINEEYQLTVAILGHINYLKGLDLVIQALNLLENHLDLSGLKLLIYGFITEPQYFESTLKNHHSSATVTYCGSYQVSQLPEILSYVDLTIVPSRSESYSLTVRESLALYTPVLAAKVGGIPDCINHGENSILFEPNNFIDLARKIEDLYSNPSKIQYLKNNIKPTKSIQNDASEYDELYHECLSRPTPSSIYNEAISMLILDKSLEKEYVTLLVESESCEPFFINLIDFSNTLNLDICIKILILTINQSLNYDIFDTLMTIDLAENNNNLFDKVIIEFVEEIDNFYEEVDLFVSDTYSSSKFPLSQQFPSCTQRSFFEILSSIINN